jgi:putative transposase
VSRRFVAKTAAQLAAWRSTPLDALDLVALLLDGVHIGEHCIVAALGIDHTGQKHALGLWDGSTENAAVCQSLLADLQSRGTIAAIRGLFESRAWPRLNIMSVLGRCSPSATAVRRRRRSAARRGAPLPAG